MVECIVFHSARPGVGKSTIAANLAAVLAARGQQVGLIDTHVQNGDLSLFFDLPAERIGWTLNDFLLQRCDGSAAFYDVTPPECSKGRIMLLPASPRPRDLSTLLHDGFQVEQVTDELPRLAEALRFDTLLIDTEAGLQEQSLLTMLALSITHTLVVVLRLDQRDYQGTGVSIDVAHTLKVPQVLLLANQVAARFKPAGVVRKLESVYKDKVLTPLPYNDELAAIGSTDLFVLRHPGHPITSLFEQFADGLSSKTNPLAA